MRYLPIKETITVSWIQCNQLLQLFQILPQALTAYHYSIRCMLEFYWIFAVLFTGRMRSPVHTGMCH